MSAVFWWVNHSHTFRHEIEGSYLWFATRPRKSKARSESEKNIHKLLPSDVVLSFAEGEIGAVGVVLATAREAAKPLEFNSLAEYADIETGWMVPVRFMSLQSPLRTEIHATEWAMVLPRKHSPILASGKPNHHMVLASVPSLMMETLFRLMSGEIQRTVGTIVEAVGRGLADDVAEVEIQRRSDISPIQKSDLLKARYGQGVFRTNVEVGEHSCRLTGVLDRRHLWARHIKPWSECGDAEKLDGSNGLLLAPHIAHLFERGYISFTDDGDLLVSQEMNPVVLDNWHIQLPFSAGEFRPEQCFYLDYHRREVFQQHGTGRRQKPPEGYESIPIVLTEEPTVVQPA